MRARRLIASTTAAIVVGAATVAAAGIERLDSPASVSVAAVRGAQFDVDPQPPAQTARYRVSYVVAWDNSTHPATLPPNAHVSPAVAVIHSEPGDLFAPGTLASNGIERMAEVGATSTLLSELAGDATVAATDTGRRIDFRGTDSFEFDVSQTNRYVSLVSMLAPSPDWFVGANSVDLFAGGDWATVIDQPLGNYDAGTDSGPNFTSANADTAPAEVIGAPRDASFQTAAAEGPFARIVIERVG